MKHVFLHVLWENFLTSFLWNIKPISTPHRVVFIQNAILLLHYTGSIYQNYHLHVLLTFISFNFPAEDKNRWSYAFIYNIWYVFFLNTDWKSDKSWTFPWNENTVNAQTSWGSENLAVFLSWMTDRPKIMYSETEIMTSLYNVRKRTTNICCVYGTLNWKHMWI